MKCRNVLYLCMILVTLSFLPGCVAASAVQQEDKAEKKFYLSRKDRMFNAAVDAFFEAVDARDAEAVKALFSQKALEEAEDIDAEIEKLFAFYPEPTQRCERDGVSTEWGSNDHGLHIRKGGDWFAVVCGGENYYCDFSMVFENDMDETEIGVWSIDLVSEKVKCAEDFQFFAGAGLHAQSEVSGDYQTRRIGHYPHVFVPADRELDREEIRAFLEQEADFGAFRERFGEPNAEICANMSYAYELPDQDGEKRYLKLQVSDGQQIRSAGIYNDVDIERLEMLWEREESD